MHGTMMPATERDRELIADLAAERARLGESQVVGIRGLAAADEARLLGDITKVLPVAIATRGSDGEDALVDAVDRGCDCDSVHGQKRSRNSHPCVCRRIMEAIMVRNRSLARQQRYLSAV